MDKSSTYLYETDEDKHSLYRGSLTYETRTRSVWDLLLNLRLLHQENSREFENLSSAISQLSTTTSSTTASTAVSPLLVSLVTSTVYVTITRTVSSRGSDERESIQKKQTSSAASNSYLVQRPSNSGSSEVLPLLSNSPLGFDSQSQRSSNRNEHQTSTKISSSLPPQIKSNSESANHAPRTRNFRSPFLEPSFNHRVLGSFTETPGIPDVTVAKLESSAYLDLKYNLLELLGSSSAYHYYRTLPSRYVMADLAPVNSLSSSITLVENLLTDETLFFRLIRVPNKHLNRNSGIIQSAGEGFYTNAVRPRVRPDNHPILRRNLRNLVSLHAQYIISGQYDRLLENMPHHTVDERVMMQSLLPREEKKVMQYVSSLAEVERLRLIYSLQGQVPPTYTIDSQWPLELIHLHSYVTLSVSSLLATWGPHALRDMSYYHSSFINYRSPIAQTNRPLSIHETPTLGRSAHSGIPLTSVNTNGFEQTMFQHSTSNPLQHEENTNPLWSYPESWYWIFNENNYRRGFTYYAGHYVNHLVCRLVNKNPLLDTPDLRKKLEMDVSTYAINAAEKEMQRLRGKEKRKTPKDPRHYPEELLLLDAFISYYAESVVASSMQSTSAIEIPYLSIPIVRTQVKATESVRESLSLPIGPQISIVRSPVLDDLRFVSALQTSLQYNILSQTFTNADGKLTVTSYSPQTATVSQKLDSPVIEQSVHLSSHSLENIQTMTVSVVKRQENNSNSQPSVNGMTKQIETESRNSKNSDLEKEADSGTSATEISSREPNQDAFFLTTDFDSYTKNSKTLSTLKIKFVSSHVPKTLVVQNKFSTVAETRYKTANSVEHTDKTRRSFLHKLPLQTSQIRGYSDPLITTPSSFYTVMDHIVQTYSSTENYVVQTNQLGGLPGPSSTTTSSTTSSSTTVTNRVPPRYTTFDVLTKVDTTSETLFKSSLPTKYVHGHPALGLTTSSTVGKGLIKTTKTKTKGTTLIRTAQQSQTKTKAVLSNTTVSKSQTAFINSRKDSFLTASTLSTPVETFNENRESDDAWWNLTQSLFSKENMITTGPVDLGSHSDYESSDSKKLKMVSSSKKETSNRVLPNSSTVTNLTDSLSKRIANFSSNVSRKNGFPSPNYTSNPLSYVEEFTGPLGLRIDSFRNSDTPDFVVSPEDSEKMVSEDIDAAEVSDLTDESNFIENLKKFDQILGRLSQRGRKGRKPKEW